jgi:hypothetical protein
MFLIVVYVTYIFYGEEGERGMSGADDVIKRCKVRYLQTKAAAVIAAINLAITPTVPFTCM